MEDEIKINGEDSVKEICLEEKLEKIAKARKSLLNNIFEDQSFENGYNTSGYDTNGKSIKFFQDGLLNIGNEGLFINWINFFCKMRGDDPEKQNQKVSPYYVADPKNNWYGSYAGTRPSAKKESFNLIPKWDVIVDKNSKEQLTTYLFSGSYLYQRNEENIGRNTYYGSLDKEMEDIVELNRPVNLFFDDRGVPHLYIFSLPGNSKTVISNKLDENFVFRIDDFDINYLNNLFLVIGGIYFSSSENKKRLLEIAEKTGSSTFSSLIKSFDNADVEKFYNSFRLFSKKFLDLKVLMQEKNSFINKYINVLITATKSFRQERTAHYRLNTSNNRISFIPFSYDREYGLGEVKSYMPFEISVKGNEVSCLYSSSRLNREEYLKAIRGRNYQGKSDLTPTRRKFLIDFGDACIKNVKEVIEAEYKSISSFSKISRDIKNSEEELNDFSNFLCKSFSSVLFLNISNE